MRQPSRRPSAGAPSFLLTVSLFAAVAWVGKDAIFSDISPEQTQLLEADPDPIVASHVSGDAVSSLAAQKSEPAAAAEPKAAAEPREAAEPKEAAEPAAADDGGDSESHEGRDYLDSISKQMQDKIQAYIGAPKLTETADNTSSTAQVARVLPILAGKSDGDLDNLANSLLDQQSNKSLSSEAQAKALVSTLKVHNVDVTAKTTDNAPPSTSATKLADKADQEMDQKAQQMYDKMNSEKLQKKQEAAVLQKKADTHTAPAPPAEAGKPATAKAADAPAANTDAAQHDAQMDSEAEKMFAAEQKKEQTLASTQGPPAAPPAPVVQAAERPGPIADVPKPAAIAGKSDGDLDAEAAAMMSHLKQTADKASKASRTASAFEQLWSAQADTNANAEAAADDKLVADLDKPDLDPIKASKAGHHTVEFDLSAVLGKKALGKKGKAKSLDELADEMMKNLDEGKGTRKHKHESSSGAAMALPPDIAAAVAKLKKDPAGS